MQSQGTSQNLLRLRIDNIKPKWVTCVWLIFFLLIGFLFLLVLAIPSGVIQYKYFEGSVCNDDGPQNDFCTTFDFETNPVYNVVLPGMSNKNQYIIIDLLPHPKSSALRYFEEEVAFNLTVYELNDNLKANRTVYENFYHEIHIECAVLLGIGACYNRTLVYVPQVELKNYLIQFTFFPSEELQARISRFDAYITTVNPKYTDFQLALRYTCLGLTCIFLFFYWVNLRRMRGEKIVFEQKYIKWLGILLIFFNDPIYAATVLKPGLFVAVISSIFMITFICALLLFWIAAFQRIYKEGNQVKTRALKSWPKLAYIFFLWLFSVVAYNILNREYLKDPSFDFNDEYKDSFKAFKILMIIFIAIGLGWLFYGFSQVLRRYNSIIWRHKMFFSFSTYFIFCFFIFLFTGSLSVYNMNGTKVILLFGIVNVYVWFLMFLYSKSGNVFNASEQPITLSEGVREWAGYEHLDESAHGDIEMNGYNQSPNKNEGAPQEERDPDQIFFQIDPSGNLYAANNNNNNNRAQQYQVKSDFDNFGQSDKNNAAYDNVFGMNNSNNANNNAEHSQGADKYPFEANDDNDDNDMS